MTKSTKSHLRGRFLLKIFSGLVAQTSANCPVGQLHNSLILYARVGCADTGYSDWVFCRLVARVRWWVISFTNFIGWWATVGGYYPPLRLPLFHLLIVCGKIRNDVGIVPYDYNSELRIPHSELILHYELLIIISKKFQKQLDKRRLRCYNLGNR